MILVLILVLTSSTLFMPPFLSPLEYNVWFALVFAGNVFVRMSKIKS